MVPTQTVSDILVPFDGELLTKYERRGLEVSGEWAVDVSNLLACFGYDRQPVELPQKCLRYDIDVDVPALFRGDHISFHAGRGLFHIYEMPSQDDPSCMYSVLLESANLECEKMGPRDFYAGLILHTLTHLPVLASRSTASIEHSTVATRVAAVFERQLLLSTTSRKGWHETGMLSFVQKATFWIERQSKIKMALPAFPCKTTSKDKAAVSVPDGGEFEALANLLEFCQKVEEVYEPGCDLYIVSDGHVFSDCIGTDDIAVTRYSHKLRDMLSEVERLYPIKKGGIKFFDLEVLLQVSTLR